MYRQKRKNKSSEVVRKFKDFGFIAAKKGNNTNIGGQWQPTPVLLPGKSHGRRSLVGYSPWGCEELDTTERLHFHFLFSCIGEGNGNPLQCSCLENPRDGGAWWAAVYGVAQSRTRLKWLSSSREFSIVLNAFSRELNLMNWVEKESAELGNVENILSWTETVSTGWGRTGAWIGEKQEECMGGL